MILCLERIEAKNAVTLDDTALLTSFVNRIPEKFQIQCIQRVLDHDNVRSFDDLMGFLGHCLRAVEHDRDEWQMPSALRKRLIIPMRRDASLITVFRVPPGTLQGRLLKP